MKHRIEDMKKANAWFRNCDKNQMDRFRYTAKCKIAVYIFGDIDLIIKNNTSRTMLNCFH